ncbi:MAG: hypothetical protein A2078_06860 [Nitrospirae bacterium GWC2_57_9]|nr:MAG: hypothetical protein A2078_06860 [Nitrospirae bacterium GWC2_57_9]
MNTSHCRPTLAVLILLLAGLLAGCQDGGTMTSMSVTPANATIATGTAQPFTATAIFTDGTTVNWTSAAVWSSSDPEAVSMNNTPGLNGIATSVTGTVTGTGTFQITATDTANSIFGTATLTVADPISISILPSEPRMAKGTSHQLILEAVLTGPTITQNIASFATWTSTDSLKAVVNSTTGIVTAGTVTGETNIEASYEFLSAPSTTVIFSAPTATLIITDTPLDSIVITPNAPSTPAFFTAQGNYTTGGPLSFTRSVIWTSSNPEVATIDKEGIIAEHGSGTTTITATDPITGKSASASAVFP